MKLPMTREQYGHYVDIMTPNSSTGKNLLLAFLFGGGLCGIGQCFIELYSYLGFDEKMSVLLCSVTMVFIGVLLSAFGLYSKLAKYGGAGTLVPITGFANSMASAAIEFKSEGLITGLATKMFIIAGPVIVYGISSSVIYGIIYAICTGAKING